MILVSVPNRRSKKVKSPYSFFQETHICLENYDYLLITTKNFLNNEKG